MHFAFEHSPALTIAMAMVVGVAAQAVARHLKLPGIVVLLAAGVVLGPDGLGLVRSAELGAALHDLTGFAVAVILFEGGLNLNLRRMRSQALTIRLLLSAGVVVTSLGGALAVRLALGWDWTTSLLFGTLVIVTGPTVITPLLRRIRVRRSVETILESEGVLIDAVGAVVAVVALEFALAAGEGGRAALLAGLPAGLLGGLAIGAAGGGVLGFLLSRPRLVPEGLGNILTLGAALALFQLSNALIPESGISAAIAAGFVVGNMRGVTHELREFKEQLTVLLIGMLFVLLAADVRMADVVALGAPGLLVAALLMFVVRPLNVAVCTAGSGLSWREKSFLAWVAPRGIVAAAVATLFRERLHEAGFAGGGELRALVFLVIASTVFFQGATAGLMARLLGVKRPTGRGYAILGAQALGRRLAAELRDGGSEVVLLDSNSQACRDAEAEGFRVVYGNALEHGVLMRAAVDTRRAAVAATGAEGINLLFTRKVRAEFKGPAAYCGVLADHGGVDPAMVREAGGEVLFGNEVDLELWNVRIRQGRVLRSVWTLAADGSTETPAELVHLALPIAVLSDDDASPYHGGLKPAEGLKAVWLLLEDRTESAREALTAAGWHEEEAEAERSPGV